MRLSSVSILPLMGALSSLLLALGTSALADDTPLEPSALRKQQAQKQLAKDPPGMIRLLPDKDVWIDPKFKRVVVDGTICLTEGQLEMFACLKGTKEHESVVTVDAEAYAIHAGLINVGAKQGTPVKFQPKYEAATGATIDITCIWTDAKGVVHRDKAQDWVRDVKSKKAMTHPWVFAGSGYWKDEDTGEQHYQAEGGYLICVSNFPSAMLDLPVESSEHADSLLFEAFTEHIPPKGTRVRLVLTPRHEK